MIHFAKHVFATGLFALASLGTAYAGQTMKGPYKKIQLIPVERVPFEPKWLDMDVAFNEQRVKNDPAGTIGWCMLGNAYLAKARDTDSTDAALKAEMAARKSLSLRRRGNVAASNLLVQCLLQEHLFQDARKESDRSLEISPEDDRAIQIKAETLTEIGRYHEAEVWIRDNKDSFKEMGGLADRARLKELCGKVDESIALMKTATAQAEANFDMPRPSVAWFHDRLGATFATLGRIEAAKAEFNNAIALYPHDWKAYAGLARLSDALGDWKAVIRYGRECDKIAPMVDVVGMMGDAYVALGDRRKAEIEYSRVGNLAGAPSSMGGGLHTAVAASNAHGHRMDRYYAMFCADHGRDLTGAYAAALRDLEQRQDEYAYDTMAWVCFKRGDVAEAVMAMDKAVSCGTLDPKVLYHAGLITAKAGYKQAGRRYLLWALAQNPQFDIVQAANARKLVGTRVGHQAQFSLENPAL